MKNAETITPRALVGEVKRDKKRRQQDAAHTLPTGRMLGTGGTKLAPRSQRELEQWFDQSEKERKALELENTRLRDIISLRQDSCQRREDSQAEELTRLKTVLQRVNFDAADPSAMMQELRQLNDQIQHEVSRLHDNIEQHSEAQKIDLIRTFRVKMHRKKKELEERTHRMKAGAQDWVQRNHMLIAERDRAMRDIAALDEKNKQLEDSNRTLVAMRAHQDDQRAVTVRKIATIKKDNKRLEEQAERLREQTTALHHRQDEFMRSQGAQSAASTASPQRGKPSNRIRSSKGLNGESVEQRYADTLLKARKTLESVRGALKKVRGAHIEYLQEHTELSIMLRQCLDDVRKDIARHSVAHYVLKVDGSAEEGLESGLAGYTIDDRKKLLEVLESKERVLLRLSDKMFPHRGPGTPDVVLTPSRAATTSSGTRLGHRAGTHNDAFGDVVDEETVATDDADAAASAELDMDRIWGKWKEWSQKL
eukprot:PhM_4_TR11475/c0_g1_i1/m.16148